MVILIDTFYLIVSSNISFDLLLLILIYLMCYLKLFYIELLIHYNQGFDQLLDLMHWLKKVLKLAMMSYYSIVQTYWFRFSVLP